MAVVCPEKLRLLTEYNRAANNYASALSVRVTKTGTVQLWEYRELEQTTEVLRQDSADARERLERHRAQHGC